MSTAQTIATVNVFDYEYATGSPTLTNPLPLVGAQIQVQLNYNLVNSISPTTNLQTLTVLTTTDNNGQWSVNLVPNTNINPANTVYTVTTPTKRYDISVPSSGPVQSSAIVVSVPPTLSPAGATVGALTVTGLLTAQAGETVAGGLTVSTGGATVTAGGLTVSAGGASITGTLAAVNAETVGGLLSANGGLAITGSLQHSTQTIAFASTITPNAASGEIVLVGALTGNITVANATSPATGQVMTFVFTQDATGGRTVSWGTAYKTAWTPPGVASEIATISFVYDGTNWQQRANAAPVNNLGATSSVGDLTLASHVLATGTAPGLGSLQTGISSQSIAGNDTRGRITIATSGSPPSTNTPLAVVTFHTAFPTGVTPVVMITDQGNSAVTASLCARSVSRTGFTLFNSGGGVGLTGTTTYIAGYHTIG